MESMGQGNFVAEDENLRESGEMIGNQNKKLTKSENLVREVNLEDKQPVGDISIMAEIFEAGKEEDLEIINDSAPAKRVVKQEAARLVPMPDLPEECEIILVVDNREKRNNQDINYFYDRFKASGIKTELKSLPLGDFIWILRLKNN